MPKRTTSIPVNIMAGEKGTGISVEKLTIQQLSASQKLDEHTVEPAHRHDGHALFLLEAGSVSIKIDLKDHQITAPALIYVHPDQVHHTRVSDNMILYSLAITDENLNTEYLVALQKLTPAPPLSLSTTTFELIRQAMLLCIQLDQRKADKLYHPTLKDSCNTVVGLILSQYSHLTELSDKRPRSEVITQAFRELLEQHYTTSKRLCTNAQHLHHLS
jgi:AraC family transcriptional regulator, transcriptional activator of pobA